MNKIKIKPISVGLNTTANEVSIQVLTLDITPEAFKLNARFYDTQTIGEETTSKEVYNAPFELPIEVYNNWQQDSYLENESLAKLGLERASNE